MQDKRLKIFVGCLNWGIGHASRVLPIIHLLEERGHDIIIGSDGKALNFLRKELPNRNFIRIKDVQVSYHPKTWKMFFRIFNLGLKMKKIRRKEHAELIRLHREENFDLIISDNRYGLFLHQVYSVLISHQLSPKVPFGQGFIRFLIANWTAVFDEVWIPDFDSSRLTGKLSSGNLFNSKTIGILSRFKPSEEKLKTIDYLFLLSGPEPLRTAFESKILAEIKPLDARIVIVRGTNKPHNISQKNGLKIKNLVHSKELKELLLSSERIICRGGYSTIMDLVQLNLSAFLVPTPGQWEQEYLAKRLTKGKLYNSCKQSQFSLDNLTFFEPPNVKEESTLLNNIWRLETKLL